MRTFAKGEKLDLLTRHQDNRRFAAEPTIGEVVEGNEKLPYTMRVRVYRRSWRPEKGYTHEFLRVSDTVWLERIRIGFNRGGATNLPHVHEIIGNLTEEEFERRHAALIEAAKQA